MTANLAGRLAESAAAHPDRIALISGRGRRRRTITFAELDDRVGRVAAELMGGGLQPGERALLFVPMSIELYVALLGVLRAGGVAVFVDAWADRRRLDAAVQVARPRFFLGTPRAHLLRAVSPAIRAIDRHRWVWREFGNRGGGASQAPMVDVSPKAHALVTFTTGSTGRPKAAARSHSFLWAQHLVLSRHLGLDATDVDMPTLPVFVLHDLAEGCTCVLPDFDPRRPADFDPAAIRTQMREERVTTCSASPVFFEKLLASGEPLPLRAAFTGGAPVLPALARRLAVQVGSGAHVVYGSTEAEPIATLTAHEMASHLTHPADGLCAGQPVDEISLRLVRAHDGPLELGERAWSEWEVPAGVTGEIVVSGEHVLTGYLDDPASDRENKVRDGERVWHRTGDAGRLDREGRLWLMGRLSQRVERDGLTHWPLPVELAALAHPEVTHAAYVTTPGGRATLCVECAHALDDPAREDLKRAAAPAPVDDLAVLTHIPRDPRHVSKTDTAALLRLLGARG